MAALRLYGEVGAYNEDTGDLLTQLTALPSSENMPSTEHTAEGSSATMSNRLTPEQGETVIREQTQNGTGVGKVDEQTFLGLAVGVFVLLSEQRLQDGCTLGERLDHWVLLLDRAELLGSGHRLSESAQLIDQTQLLGATTNPD